MENLSIQCYLPVLFRSLSKKLTFYNYYVKPKWLYGCQPYGSASTYNISHHQSSLSKNLRLITSAAWYVQNETLHTYLLTPFVRHTVTEFYKKFH